MSDADIKGTDEYKELVKNYVKVPYIYTENDAVLACKLAIRTLRQGGAFDVKTQGLSLMDRARMQSSVAEKAESLENQLSWEAETGYLETNNFGKWLLDVKGAKKPSLKDNQMNCWEMVMFSAMELGYTDKAHLKSLYEGFVSTMKSNGNDHVAAFGDMEAALQGSNPQPYVSGDADSARPLSGDIVIFGGGMYQHVAIATGKMITKGKEKHAEIMSLWSQNSGTVYRTTIEELNSGGDAIRFFSPKWQ